MIIAPPAANRSGFWTTGENINIKLLLDEYARTHNFDPLVAENWYKINGKNVLSFQVGVCVLS